MAEGNSAPKSPLLRCLPTEGVIISILAFVGGYVDTVGYLECLGVFTSSITGNLVVASASMTSTEGVFCRCIITVSFTICAAINTAISLYFKLRKVSEHNIAAILFIFEAIVLLIAMLVGVSLTSKIEEATNPDEWSVVVVACVLAASMGLHNGAVKESVSGGPSTTVMTMTLVSIANLFSNSVGFYIAKHSVYARLSMEESENDDEAEDSIELEKLKAEVKKLEDKFADSLDKLLSNLRNLVFFVVGAVLGAVITYHGAHFVSLVVPIIMILYLVLNHIVLGNFVVDAKMKGVIKKPIHANPNVDSSTDVSTTVSANTQDQLLPPVSPEISLEMTELSSDAEPKNHAFF